MGTERTFRGSWVWAGVLAIASTLVSLDPQRGVFVGWISPALMAAAVFLVGFVGPRARNIVRGDPLGTVMLTLWSSWWLVSAIMVGVPSLAVSIPGDAWALIGFALGLVVALMIARSGGFTSRWRWAPLAVLGVAAVAWAALQIVLIAMSPSAGQASLAVVFSVGSLVTASWPVALGVLAILAGAGLGREPRLIEVVESSDAAPVHDEHA